MEIHCVGLRFGPDLPVPVLAQASAALEYLWWLPGEWVKPEKDFQNRTREVSRYSGTVIHPLVSLVASLAFLSWTSHSATVSF